MRAKIGSCLAALALVLVTGCGAGPKKTIDGSCETSADCGGGVCFAEKCYTTCATPAECKPDEFCVVPASATDLTICMAKSDFAGCQGDAECPSLVGSPCQHTLCDTEASLCDVANRDAGTACETTGGNSGSCTDEGACVCTPNCDGRDCGGDGCGGICGLCANGATCMEGTCRGACVPDGAPSDVCDGKDNDCDGATDEDFVAAETTTCGAGACAAVGQRVCQDGAEVDTCQPGQGAADDTICDGVDDDCDGATDEDYLPVEISCGDFACQQTGTTYCEGGQVADSCTPGTPADDDTVCNNIDDDCDGPIDEDFVPAPTSCGVGACAATGQTTCLEGVPGSDCVPGTAAPTDGTCDGADDDCDGSTDEEFLSDVTSCGVGACAATGAITCSGGQMSDSCLPGTPAADDATCDGIDDDCDGSTDEEFAVTEIACGIGACQAIGTTVCVDGQQSDSCSPSGAAGSDAVCNGIDDDCDEATDEDFVSAETTCGVGACAAGGQTACVDGVQVDLCQPGVPASADATCDGLDDDCNGTADDGFEVSPSACGVGACAATGELTCLAGAVNDSCVAAPPLATDDVTCDAVDDDCDGTADDDFSATLSACGVGACSAEGLVTCTDGSLADSCVAGEPAAADASCDGLDDDCDAATDEEYVAPATTCGAGACAAMGELACQGGLLVDTCQAGAAALVDPTCDGVDDDCDGSTDDEYAPTATFCGVGGCAAIGQRLCSDGVETDSCSPGVAAADDADCDGVDDDCDGSTDEEYVAPATTCGVGACASVGALACTDGVATDTCVQGAPAADDATCDGVDDDCDGNDDEEYAPVTTACGVGACLAEGTTVCLGGVVSDSCSPGDGTGSDTVCNGIDDDCDGSTDEDFAPAATTCGVGACAAAGVTSCQGGAPVDSCVAGTPAAADATCNGVDDDCNGASDEDYVLVTTTCGEGACARTGNLSCAGGQLSDSCLAGTPAASDATCDALDDDCDGSADEDYAVTATTCGVGACASAGQKTCSNGAEIDSCVAGIPAGSDATCDGVDDDCSGTADEDYLASASSCGTGACARSGQLTCVTGQVVDSCVAGAPASADATCNAVDDDCNGATDEDYVVTATACGTGACARSGLKTCSAGAESDSCVAGSPAALDATCDGVDDDCNGASDEDYPVTATACGVGACARTGQQSCVGGQVVDSCVAGLPAATDASCNAIDDDCSGATDEDYPITATACGTGACARTGQLTCVAGTESNSCLPGAAAPSDATCNGIDDDCNAATDEDYVVTATACGTGACARTGQKTCAGGAESDSCVAGLPAPSDATCNAVDDDCNGATDEDYVVTTTSCGLGVCAASGQKTCAGGAESDSCTPGSPALEVCNGLDDDCNGKTDAADTQAIAGNVFLYDQPSCEKTTGVCASAKKTVAFCKGGAWLACNTTIYTYWAPTYQAVEGAACDGLDNDCDAATDEAYVPTATSCGQGACAATGQIVCQGGTTTDTCTPGTPGGVDTDCDAIDDNCNGQTDEGFVPIASSCGIGACARTGQKTCSNGQLVDSCVSGTPAASDATCDAVDDDCSGTTDEDFVVVTTSCGVGACARSGQRICTAGAVSDTCAPGTPAASDATCNSIDDDCSGAADEDYVVTATSCGVGACARTGQKSCTAGRETDSCVPGVAGLEVCNGIDDDCNGKTDAADGARLLANDQPFCEKQAGVCLNTKKTAAFCVAGGWKPCNDTLYRFLAPAYVNPEAPDCDAKDNDCDASTDEAYVASATSCGTGVCASTGTTVCQGGVVGDTCSPGEPWGSTDYLCDGLDQDCDGQTDETPEADAACADAVACSVDTCDPLVSQCGHAPDHTACDDGLACSIDTCDLVDGGCTHIGIDTACDDGVACTDDFCYVPVTGPVGTVPPILPVTGGPTAGCNHTAQNALCDDKNSCTTDACTATGCVSTYQGDQTPCDDADACTYADICFGGTCRGGAPVTCVDGDPCTTDSCDPATGCTYPPLVCDDQIACTDDYCNPDLGGCDSSPNDALCADTDPCTLDLCIGGEGCSNSVYSCDDGIACTADACDGAGGCNLTPDDTWCVTNDPANPVCALDMGCMPCDDTNGLLWDGCTAWNISEAALHSLTNLNERKPDVTVLPDGGFAVAWERADGQGLVSQVKTRAFKADGTQTLSELLVNASSSGTHLGPRVVARNPASDLMVSWEHSYGAAAVILDYVMRPFTGAAGGAELLVAGGVAEPGPNGWDLASAPQQGTLVQVWSDTNSQFNSGVHARLFDKDGAAVSAIIDVVPNISSNGHSRPRVAQWADGSFVVVWEDVNGTYGYGPSVVGQVFTPAGLPSTDIFVIDESQWMGERRQPDVAAFSGMSGNELVVTWQRSDPFRNQLYAIALAQFAANGAQIGVVVDVQPDTPTLAETPVVAIDDAGYIAVAWDMGAIYAATYKPGIDGEPLLLSPAAQVNVHPYGSMANPSIAKFADGSFVIVWDSCPGETTQDQQVGGSGCGIYGRKYSYDGVPIWLPVDRPIL